MIVRRETEDDLLESGRGVNNKVAVRVALLGCGTVGSDVVRLLHEQATDLTARIGAPLQLVGVAVRRIRRDRGDLPLDPALFTTDRSRWSSGTTSTWSSRSSAASSRRGPGCSRPCAAGKSVVTANKALLAEDGATLHGRPPRPAPTCTTRPRSPGRSRCCARCASRCTATGSPGSPASSTARRTSSCRRWTAAGTSFAEALEEATALGYAEADPTADVEGFDAAAKAAILASLAFHTRVTAADVYREGITEVTAADVASAKAMGCTIKLLCIAARTTGPEGPR